MGASRGERQGDKNGLRKEHARGGGRGDRESRILTENQSNLHTQTCTCMYTDTRSLARLALLATLVGYVGRYAKHAAESTTQHTQKTRELNVL